MKIICAKIMPIIKMSLFSMVAVTLAFLVTFINAGTLFFGHASRLVPIYSVERNEKKVALTFDAAWGSDKTEKIVSILKENNVQGTFFLVGFWIEANKDMVKMIDEAGLDIGTHSSTHPQMSKLSESQIEKELSNSMNLIQEITNKKVEYFRPPYGDYNDTLINVATGLGLKTIQWDVDTLDWKGLSASEILSRVKSSAKNGSIILCHNNSDHIIEALPLIIDYLKSENYEMVKISDLVYKSNYTIDNNGTQKQNVK